MSNGFVIDTPEGIQAFQLLRVRSALSIEVKTGMKLSRGSVMKLAKSYCGSRKNTKKGVYADYNAYLVSLGFEDKPL